MQTKVRNHNLVCWASQNTQKQTTSSRVKLIVALGNWFRKLSLKESVAISRSQSQHISLNLGVHKSTQTQNDTIKLMTTT